MHSILIDGKVILAALEAEEPSDVDLLWQVLQSGVKGYITQADLDLLFVNITRSQGLENATQVIHHLQKTLVPVPEQPPKFDYHITSQFSNCDFQNNEIPIVSVSEYLERLSLDLIYHHQPGLSQKPRKALMQWYQKAAGFGFDSLLIIPFAMTLLLQSLSAFDKVWGHEPSQHTQKDNQLSEDKLDNEEELLDGAKVEDDLGKSGEWVNGLIVEASDYFNRDGRSTAHLAFIAVENNSLFNKKTILVADDNNHSTSKEKESDIDHNEILAIIPDQAVNVDSSFVLDFQNDQDPFPAPWENATTGTNESDQLQGGDQDDYLWGLDNDDKLIGGFGNDILDGGSGDDVLIGDQGNDRLFGASGKDLILGGSGQDMLLGGLDSDTLQGENGDDFLDGGEGEDILIGNGGNDILVGGLGNDSLHGGLGNDVFVLESNSGADKVYDYEVGKDVFALSKGLAFSDLTFIEDIQGVTIVVDANQSMTTVLGTTIAEIAAPSNFISSSHVPGELDLEPTTARLRIKQR